MSAFTESVVEEPALEWFGALPSAVLLTPLPSTALERGYRYEITARAAA